MIDEFVKEPSVGDLSRVTEQKNDLKPAARPPRDHQNKQNSSSCREILQSGWNETILAANSATDSLLVITNTCRFYSQEKASSAFTRSGGLNPNDGEPGLKPKVL